MVAALEAPRIEYPLDENGVPIKPGYRKPFTSESGRIATVKAQANLKAERELYRKLGLHKQRPSKLVYAVRNAIIKHAAASCSPNLPDCGLQHAKNAKLFNDIHMSLTGVVSRANSTKNHSLQLSDSAPKVAPISTAKPTAISPTITPQSVDQNASEVKPEGKNLDDCPF